jgi:hypothetical protein
MIPPHKKSRKELLHDRNKLEEEVRGLQKRIQQDAKVFFKVVRRFHEIKPDDDVFSDGTINEKYVEIIKKAAPQMKRPLIINPYEN